MDRAGTGNFSWRALRREGLTADAGTEGSKRGGGDTT